MASYRQVNVQNSLNLHLVFCNICFKFNVFWRIWRVQVWTVGLNLLDFWDLQVLSTKKLKNLRITFWHFIWKDHEKCPKTIMSLVLDIDICYHAFFFRIWRIITQIHIKSFKVFWSTYVVIQNVVYHSDVLVIKDLCLYFLFQVWKNEDKFWSLDINSFFFVVVNTWSLILSDTSIL